MGEEQGGTGVGTQYRAEFHLLNLKGHLYAFRMICFLTGQPVAVNSIIVLCHIILCKARSMLQILTVASIMPSTVNLISSFVD